MDRVGYSLSMYFPRFILYIFCLTFCFTYRLAAQNDIDSLQSLLTLYNTEDTLKVRILNQLGYEYWIIDPALSEDYGNQALSISTRLNDQKGKAFALRVIGVSHWTRGNFELGFVNLLRSKSDYQALNDVLGEANCDLNIGLIFADRRIYDRAISSFEKAVEGFKSEKRMDRVATAYNKMGDVYIRNQDYDVALSYLLNAIDIHTKNNFDYGVSEANLRLGELYLAKNDFFKAQDYFNRSLLVSERISDSDGLTKAYLNLGKVFYGRGEKEKANNYLLESERIAKSYGGKVLLKEIYKSLKELAEHTNQWKDAVYYSDMYIAVSDSLFNERLANRIAEIEKKNELSEQQLELIRLNNETEYLTRENTLNRNLKYTLAFSLILILISVYLLFNRQKLKIVKNRIIVESEKEMAELALEKAQLEQNRLERELNYRNKELTSHTMNFIRKKEIALSLKDKLKELKQALDNDHSRQINQLVKLADSIQDSDKEWDEFKLYFENVHTNFFKNLSMTIPNLSSNEMRLAALVRLNLNLKEISSILGISPDSVKTARYRLKKKLRLEKEDSLLGYLMSIDQEVN